MSDTTLKPIAWETEKLPGGSPKFRHVLTFENDDPCFGADFAEHVRRAAPEPAPSDVEEPEREEAMNKTSHFLRKVEKEVAFARTKFPGNEQMVAALMEEVGELAQALIDHHRGKQTAGDVYHEAVQVACVAMRIAEEGSAEFPKFPRWPFERSKP